MRLREALPFILVILSAVGLTSPTLHAPFFWDDELILQGREFIKEAPIQAFSQPLFREGVGGNYYRPVPMFLWGLVGNVSGSESPVSFHALQIASVALFVFLLLLFLRNYLPVAWAVVGTLAVLFFPPNIETFAWLSAFPDLVVAIFALGFLIRWRLDAGRRYPSIPLVLLLAGALFSKESAFALLLAALAMDLPRWKDAPLQRLGRFHGPLWAVFALYLAVRALVVPQIPNMLWAPVVWLKTVGAYLLKLVDPWPLSVLIERMNGEVDFRVFLGTLGLLALLGIMVRSSGGPARVFGAVFLAFLVPYLNLWTPFGERYLIAERYMLMLSVAAVGLLLLAARRLPCRIGLVVATVPVLLWAPSAWQRAHAWADEERIWGATIAAYPEFFNPHLWLAAHHLEQGNPQAAHDRIETALQSLALPGWKPSPDHYYSAFSVGQRAATELGKYDLALEYARARYKIRPNLQTAIEGFQLHDRRFDRPEALQSLVRTTRAFPQAVEFATFALGYAVLSGDESGVRAIREAAPAIPVEAAAAFSADSVRLAKLTRYERGQALAAMNFFAPAFWEFSAGATEMTREQALTVAAIARKERFGAAERRFSALADEKGAVPVREAAPQKR
jgi:hypothetical protein